MQRVSVSLQILAFCALLVSCSLVSRTPLPERQVKSLHFVPAGKVIVVGRIDLTPPIQEQERNFRSPRSESMKNVFVLYAGDRLRDLQLNKPSVTKGPS